MRDREAGPARSRVWAGARAAGGRQCRADEGRQCCSSISASACQCCDRGLGRLGVIFRVSWGGQDGLTDTVSGWSATALSNPRVSLSPAVTRKVRVLNVVYNSTNNELVRTNTLVKSGILQIDAAPFKAWYEQFYGVVLGQKKKVRCVAFLSFPPCRQWCCGWEIVLRAQMNKGRENTGRGKEQRDIVDPPQHLVLTSPGNIRTLRLPRSPTMLSASSPSARTPALSLRSLSRSSTLAASTPRSPPARARAAGATGTSLRARSLSSTSTRCPRRSKLCATLRSNTF